MHFCAVPWHTRRVNFLRRIFKRNKKGTLNLPPWTKDKDGRPPRLLAVQIYKEGELEFEVETRACKGCLRRVIYYGIGIPRDKLAENAPEFSSFIGWEPDDTTFDKDFKVYKQKFTETMHWLRVCMQVIEERWGKPPGKPAIPPIMEPKQK